MISVMPELPVCVKNESPFLGVLMRQGSMILLWVAFPVGQKATQVSHWGKFFMKDKRTPHFKPLSHSASLQSPGEVKSREVELGSHSWILLLSCTSAAAFRTPSL